MTYVILTAFVFILLLESLIAGAWDGPSRSKDPIIITRKLDEVTVHTSYKSDPDTLSGTVSIDCEKQIWIEENSKKQIGDYLYWYGVKYTEVGALNYTEELKIVNKFGNDLVVLINNKHVPISLEDFYDTYVAK
tara:strand:- start:75053 stop:75454 length:402 start_codon:yes stop_codon:yes gene_type:complete